MITQMATAICLLACMTPALADDEKDKETHPETPSSLLQSLPAEVQKNIEQVRTACREYWNNIGADPSQPISPFTPEVRRVSSGDDGLILFTVSGTQAVMVSNLELCGGQCLKGAVCSTVGSYDINIYVRTGHAWRNALSTRVGAAFLSTDKETHTKFNALVLSVSGADDKNCRVQFWKQYCDMVVKWDGKKFTFKPL
jgi:hypothetical protein